MCCSLCGCPLKAKWLDRPLRAKSINGVVVCGKCRDGFGIRRHAAFAIDAAVYLLLWCAALEGVRALIWPGARPLHLLERGWMQYLGLLLFILKDGFSDKSAGRWLLGLTVIDHATRQPIGFVQSFKRNLVVIYPYIGVIAILCTILRGRRIGDDWAGTEVIWDKHRRKSPFEPRSTVCACDYDLTGNVTGVCPECGCATKLGKGGLHDGTVT